MASRILSHGDYTVAWICALPLEIAVARIMLDEVHASLPQRENDHNIYTLGNVSGHNVVVACLPLGVYGTISASIVVSHMVSTFPNIRFGLIVGIGGGVPSGSADIRLGDVVVSKPTAASGGVIQYDYGKTLSEGQFQRTGSLNKPPPVLLKAMAQMESDYVTGKNIVSDIIGDALQKEEIREKFPRPEYDWLFRRAYNHERSEANCSACDQNQLADRSPRTTNETYIHYGLIASGDQVMKDARTRDFMARDLDILCFEMEAAGIMDELPSLTIRGICDYSDSHKNKEWQGYAALAAAAYAKALLSVVPIYCPKKGVHALKEPVWMVPFRKNMRFVGREEEISEIEGLITQQDGPGRVAICGLGGIGKTQIALELACRWRERIPCCSIFWIPCTSYESVEQGYRSIAQIVGIHGVKPTEVKNSVKSYLSQKTAGNWLLFFDNADDMDMWVESSTGTPALTEFLPRSENGHILFTTRNRKLAVKLVSSHVITVFEPDTATAVEILRKSLVEKELLNDANAAIALLNQLAFLPLAIAQAAAYINENNICLPDYSTLLQEQEADVIELLSEDFGDEGRYKNMQSPVATTWWISFQQIQRLDQTAADYLSFMACINTRNIPQSLLPQAISRKKRVDAIGLLKAFSFITVEGRNRSLSLHRLVHLSTRNWMRKNQQFGLQILRTAERLTEAFPDDNNKNREKWREYLPHALSLIKESEFQGKLEGYIFLVQNIGKCLFSDGRYHEAAELFFSIMSVQQKRKGITDPSALAAMSAVASAYRKQGLWNEAEGLEVQVLQIRTQVLGSNDPDTLASMHNLAISYLNQGRWREAEKLQAWVRKTRGNILGPEHLDTLNSSGNLALIYRNQGRWKEAEKLGLQVVEARRRVLGTEHPDTLTSMADLALALSSQGKRKQAEKIRLQVLETRKNVLGTQHPDTLTSMGDLASTFSSQGQWQKAEKIELQVLEMRRKTLGQEHPDTLTTLASLASTYWNRGQWKEAEKLELQVLTARKKVLRPGHPDTLSIVANLASTYRNRGRWEGAERLMLQVLHTRNKALGPEHPDTLDSMASLVLTYRNQGRWKEAEHLGLQVLETRKRVLGSQNRHTLTSMASLASIFSNQGRLDEAEQLAVQVLKTRRSILGPEHPDTLTSMASLASILSSQGRLDEAEQLGMRVVETRKAALGSKHPDTLTSMASLASILSSQGRLDDAEQLAVQVLKKRSSILGPEHPDTLTSMASLASILSNQGRLDEAERLGVQVLEKRKSILGPKHPSTLSSAVSLTSTLSNKGQWNEAEYLGLRVLETLRAVLGAGHPFTLAGMTNMASIYKNQGQWKEAEELRMQVLEMENAVGRTSFDNHLGISENITAIQVNGNLGCDNSEAARHHEYHSLCATGSSRQIIGFIDDATFALLGSSPASIRHP
jgi:tetratricopeptide (TPR) repeat protein/nucleoside phosphorylase